MPADSTPRIVAFFKAMPVPGRVSPGRANTPFMPVRALAAPHTTWTLSWPVSTRQTVSRSASGCFSTFST